MHHDDKTRLEGQLRRMEARCDEAVKRWALERAELEAEIRKLREQLADALARQFAK